MKHLFNVVILLILPLQLQASDKHAILKIRGHIDDAGYDGFVYALHNTLSNGLFIPGSSQDIFLCQVLLDGKWTDCIPSNFREPHGVKRLNRQYVAKWKQKYSTTEWNVSSSYLKANSTRSGYAPYLDVAGSVWRIGVPYVTEKQFRSGEKISTTSSICWSDPILPNIKTPALTFHEAFERGIK